MCAPTVACRAPPHSHSCSLSHLSQGSASSTRAPKRNETLESVVPVESPPRSPPSPPSPPSPVPAIPSHKKPKSPLQHITSFFTSSQRSPRSTRRAPLVFYQNGKRVWTQRAPERGVTPPATTHVAKLGEDGVDFLETQSVASTVETTAPRPTQPTTPRPASPWSRLLSPLTRSTLSSSAPFALYSNAKDVEAYSAQTAPSGHQVSLAKLKRIKGYITSPLLSRTECSNIVAAIDEAVKDKGEFGSYVRAHYHDQRPALCVNPVATNWRQ